MRQLRVACVQSTHLTYNLTSSRQSNGKSDLSAPLTKPSLHALHGRVFIRKPATPGGAGSAATDESEERADSESFMGNSADRDFIVDSSHSESYGESQASAVRLGAARPRRHSTDPRETGAGPAVSATYLSALIAVEQEGRTPLVDLEGDVDGSLGVETEESWSIPRPRRRASAHRTQKAKRAGRGTDSAASGCIACAPGPCRCGHVKPRAFGSGRGAGPRAASPAPEDCECDVDTSPERSGHESESLDFVPRKRKRKLVRRISESPGEESESPFFVPETPLAPAEDRGGEVDTDDETHPDPTCADVGHTLEASGIGVDVDLSTDWGLGRTETSPAPAPAVARATAPGAAQPKLRRIGSTPLKRQLLVDSIDDSSEEEVHLVESRDRSERVAPARDEEVTTAVGGAGAPKPLADANRGRAPRPVGTAHSHVPPSTGVATGWITVVGGSAGGGGARKKSLGIRRRPPPTNTSA